MASLNDLISQGYGGYRGWKETEALADFEKTKGAGKYDPGSSQQYAQQTGQSYAGPSGVGNFTDYVAQAQEMYKKAAEPAIASLQAQAPEIKSSIASKSQLLKDRYNNLISDIKGGQQKAEQRQTVVTAGELGKRGIDPTSTIYGQELTNALNPITGEYTGMLKSAATDQTAGQLELADLETTQLRNLANTIAQLNMGVGTSAIDTALSQYQYQQNAAAQALANSQDQAYKNKMIELEKSKGNIEVIGGNKYLVNPYTGAKTLLGASGSGEAGMTLEDMIKKVQQLNNQEQDVYDPVGTGWNGIGTAPWVQKPELSSSGKSYTPSSWTSTPSWAIK